MNMIATQDDARDPSYTPWGFKFGSDNLKLNVLCFTSYRETRWYQCDIFAEWLKGQKHFFQNFSARLGYGASMGGFGVSKFSPLLYLDRVLLLNPISTLCGEKVPWETRYFNGASKTLSWGGGYSDGAEHMQHGIIVFDPLFHLDKNHARRYKGLHEVYFPGVGHQIPEHLKNLGLLKILLHEFVHDSVNFLQLRRNLRKRRGYEHYYNWLLSSQNSNLRTFKRAATIEKFRKNLLLHCENGDSIPDSEFRNEIMQLALKVENYNLNAYQKIIDGLNSLKRTGSKVMLVEVLRDSALDIYKKDSTLALTLMEYAKSLRPNGPFINKKILEWSNAK